MSKADYYELLSVQKNASADDLKKSYRKLAMQFHPDRNPGDKAAEEKFKEISEAYEVLKDDQKRAAYDRMGHAAFQQGGGGGPQQGHGFDFNGQFSDIFDEMFGDFMGGGRSSGAAATRGNDLRYNLDVSLEQSYQGVQTKVKVPTNVACDPCHGSGAEKGTQPKVCTTCQGRGKVRSQQGFFTVERTCPTCHGMGKMIEKPCKSCGGAGRVRKEKTLAVNIPAGVEEGSRIRLTGEGEAGLRGGPAGDLYIFVAIKAHKLFQREGSTIYCRVPLSMTTAALGGSIEVPTLDGSKSRVVIPAGTQTGQKFRLKNKGMCILRSSSFGDMYIEAKVETPVNLTKRQKELLQEFDESAKNSKTNPQSEGFFAKVKEFWGDGGAKN